MLRTPGTLALAAGLLVLWPGAAHADRLDRQLNERMPVVVKYLQGKGYKNIGVLRFRAQRGARPASFSLGPINASMPQALENLLIMHAGDDRGPRFGILRAPGQVAQQLKVGPWYSSAAERRKLFEGLYPLAWGTQKVKPDAFLTGRVVLSVDLKKTTVTLEAFSKASPTLARVTEFTVATDAALLRDLGYGFALTTQQRGALARGRSPQQLDDLILEQVQPQKPQTAPQQGKATPADTAGIELKVRADGEVVPIQESQGTGTTRWQVPCPARSKTIVLSLTNHSDRVRGVVLRVAGMNTIGQEKDEAVRCRKWVIPAGKTFDIKGFYVGEKFEKHLPFTALDGEDARAAIEQLGDKTLFVQVDVFENVPGPTQPLTISPRGLPQGKERSARASYATLRQELLKQSRLKKVRGRNGAEVIVPAPPEDARENPALQEVDFEKRPLLIGALTIRVAPGEALPPAQPQP